jgi:hypothetical protein
MYYRVKSDKKCSELYKFTGTNGVFFKPTRQLKFCLYIREEIKQNSEAKQNVFKDTHVLFKCIKTFFAFNVEMATLRSWQEWKSFLETSKGFDETLSTDPLCCEEPQSQNAIC